MSIEYVWRHRTRRVIVSSFYTPAQGTFPAIVELSMDPEFPVDGTPINCRVADYDLVTTRIEK